MSRRRQHPASTALVVAVAMTAVVALAVAAQDDQQAQIFLDRVEVDVVNLEVVVTDRRGNPIRGLTREDFVVLEDGKPVELTNFYAIEGAAQVAAEQPGVLPGVEGPAGAVPPMLPPEQRLNLAVVVDNANISSGSRKRVLNELREHLHAVLRPGDRVMVATLEPLVRVRQGFTDDPAVITAAIDQLAGSAPGRSNLDAQRRVIQRSIATLDDYTPSSGNFRTQDTPEDAADRTLSMIENYGSQAETVVQRTFGSLGQVTGSLAGLPGRRAVFFVTENLSTNPVQGLLDQWYMAYSPLVPGLEQPQRLGRTWDMTPQLQELGNRAAADRVTFYTLHAGGAFGDLPSAEVGSLSTASVASSTTYERQPLSHLAMTTGGSAMFNAGNVRGLLDQVGADFRDYYSLGYSSPKSQDGKFHRIEVRVREQEVRVRHPVGYRAKTAEQRMQERTISALMFDVAENPLGIKVQLMPETRQDKHWLLPVLVRVPISQLVLIPRNDQHVAQLSIVIAVRDADGGLSEPQSYELPVAIPNDRLLESMGQEIGHGINLLVRAGDSKLAVGVRDEYSAVESTLNLNFSAGEG